MQNILSCCFKSDDILVLVCTLITMTVISLQGLCQLPLWTKKAPEWLNKNTSYYTNPTLNWPFRFLISPENFPPDLQFKNRQQAERDGWLFKQCSPFYLHQLKTFFVIKDKMKGTSWEFRKYAYYLSSWELLKGKRKQVLYGRLFVRLFPLVQAAGNIRKPVAVTCQKIWCST